MTREDENCLIVDFLSIAPREQCYTFCILFLSPIRLLAHSSARPFVCSHIHLFATSITFFSPSPPQKKHSIFPKNSPLSKITFARKNQKIRKKHPVFPSKYPDFPSENHRNSTKTTHPITINDNFSPSQSLIYNFS